MDKKKKKMTGLFRDNPETPEGKYLVRRRDSTIPQWPSFVLGAADPFAEVAIRAYAEAVRQAVVGNTDLAEETGVTIEYAARLRLMANEWREWRLEHGTGDPGMGAHRKDDPATVEAMKHGKSC